MIISKATQISQLSLRIWRFTPTEAEETFSATEVEAVVSTLTPPEAGVFINLLLHPLNPRSLLNLIHVPYAKSVVNQAIPHYVVGIGLTTVTSLTKCLTP